MTDLFQVLILMAAPATYFLTIRMIIVRQNRRADSGSGPTSQEGVLRRQPPLGKCAEGERLGVAQPDAALDGILHAHQ